MTVKNQLLYSLALFFVFFFNINTYADKYDTPAVIINQSNAFWIVRIVLAGGTLIADASDCQNKQECLIPPKFTKVIFYRSGSSIDIVGTAEISDTRYDAVSKTYVKNKTHVYEIDTRSLWHPNTPDIEHDGDTGSVTLNKPTYGSITITSDNWCGNL